MIKKTKKIIAGTSVRPRVSVFRSNRVISAQLIDDQSGKTVLFGAADFSAGKKPTEVALSLGEDLAKRAKAKKILEAVYDRGSYRYHGRVQALAEGLRSGGLKL
ncbi:MAG: 50S ribosomal protein L18 [Patescibacteria group bacterium]